MRVIAGDFKGTRIKSVAGRHTRPTSNKIKEAVFQMIGPFFDGGNCLDLFAGSGALGIEALSRGMDYAVFIDKNRQAIKTIDTNIKTLNLELQTKIMKNDSTRVFQTLKSNKSHFDLILIDPPYQLVNYNEIIEQIMAFGLLNKDGLIVCEYDPTIEIKYAHKKLKIIKQANYGTTSIIIYRQIEEDLSYE